MGKRQETIGQTDLVESLQNSRVERIPAEVTVEVAMRFEQRHGDAFPREKKRQDDAGRARSDDDAGRLGSIENVVDRQRLLADLRCSADIDRH
jgi:hypothetical protein